MSSEEPFNYIEHKIQEAAENQQIVFEESSWEKMEALLDKKQRRRPFIWFWFLLPLAIAFGFGLSFLGQHTPQKEITYASSPHVNLEHKPTNSVKAKPAIDEKVFTEIAVIPKDNLNVIQNKNLKTISQIKTAINYKDATTAIENNYQKGNIFTEDTRLDLTIKNNIPLENEAEPYLGKHLKPGDSESIVKNDTTAITITDNTKSISKKEPTTKKKSSVPSKFYLVGAFGAELSSTKFLAFKNSPMSPKYGVGIGYNINKHVSVQTGFYAGKKKYIANEGEYNFKAGSYYTMVKVTKVDANCIVYEIPVSVRYNVLQKRSWNIYAGAGLSSYIMKREDYNVYFIRNSREVSYPWKYTGNKDIVSTLVLSGGMEKQINEKISLQIEPSVSLPLKGVGEGDVKIFSTGLQLGLKYFPFKK